MKNRTNSTTVLRCQNLTVGYKDIEIVSNINIELQSGHFIGMLGPNGAGKTTLLRTLSRHLEPLSGSVTIMGRPLKDLRQGELAKIMAVVLTDKVTPPLFTVFDFVALGRYPHTDFLGRLTDNDCQVIENSLTAVRAESLAHRDFASLSDGERQKVLVARALAQEPKILLLDEPTAHLDLKHRVEVMDILRNLCRDKNITVIASLHDVDIAAKVSDRVALVKEGTVSHFGYPEEVLCGKTVSDLYDFELACFDHRLGSIELRSDNRQNNRVFVAAGMGSGAVIYRLLAKRGYEVSTGVLHSNDLDCYVAQSLGASCISQKPSSNLDGTRVNQAMEEMSNCDFVIDAGFPDDGAYSSNHQLLNNAVALGKPIFRLRPENNDSSRNMKCYQSASQLLDAMEFYQHGNQQASGF